MQPTGSRETLARRSRVACRVCGSPVELHRMREHLRREHQVGSAELEGLYLSARIEARRGRRAARL